MRVFTIDCSALRTEDEFWATYLAITGQERGYFGCNLDAFWDALHGGPGSPGECELRFINTSVVQTWRAGNFYRAMQRIAKESKLVAVHVE